MEWSGRAPPNRRVMLGSGKCQTEHHHFQRRNRTDASSVSAAGLCGPAREKWARRSSCPKLFSGARGAIALPARRLRFTLDQAGAPRRSPYFGEPPREMMRAGARGSLTPRRPSAAHTADQSRVPPCSRQSGRTLRVGREDAARLDSPCSDGCESCGRNARMLAARAEPKNGPPVPHDLIQPPALDHKTIRGPTSVGVPSRLSGRFWNQ
jgi:hypothetical protein